MTTTPNEPAFDHDKATYDSTSDSAADAADQIARAYRDGFRQVRIRMLGATIILSGTDPYLSRKDMSVFALRSAGVPTTAFGIIIDITNESAHDELGVEIMIRDLAHRLERAGTDAIQAAGTILNKVADDA